MDNLTELYCHIDDFYQQFKPEFDAHLIATGHQRLRACQISVAEIMTILVLFHQLRYRQFKAFYYHHMLGMMKRAFPLVVLLSCVALRARPSTTNPKTCMIPNMQDHCPCAQLEKKEFEVCLPMSVDFLGPMNCCVVSVLVWMPTMFCIKRGCNS